MKKNIISFGKVLSDSFQFTFSNFNHRIKEAFPIILMVTVLFNILNYLISNSIATNFTLIFFFIFIMIVTSTIGIAVHEEILRNNKISFFNEFFSFRSIKYFINFTILILISLIPVFFNFFYKKIYFGTVKFSFIIFLWFCCTLLALKLIFILPKIAIGKKFSYSIKELNNVGLKLLFLFILVTLIFLVPSMMFLSVQLSFMNSYVKIYPIVKPLFDVGSFYISYLNYIVVFAIISYFFRDFFYK